MKRFDFSGWATRNNLRCSDGRTILKDAFKDNDGQTVPLVWNHQHSGPDNVLGHALLENRKDGVYAYCSFNDTEQGKIAKIIVEHGDVSALSIFANQLKERGSNVLHGVIREVSLVLAGANPGAWIDTVTLSHGDDADGEAIICTGEAISLYHSDDKKERQEDGGSDDNPEDKGADGKKDGDEETVADVFNTLNEKQKNVVYLMIGQALEEKEGSDGEKKEWKEKGGNETMKHNVFERVRLGIVMSCATRIRKISSSWQRAARWGVSRQRSRFMRTIMILCSSMTLRAVVLSRAGMGTSLYCSRNTRMCGLVLRN